MRIRPRRRAIQQGDRFDRTLTAGTDVQGELFELDILLPSAENRVYELPSSMEEFDPSRAPEIAELPTIGQLLEFQHPGDRVSDLCHNLALRDFGIPDACAETIDEWETLLTADILSTRLEARNHLIRAVEHGGMPRWLGELLVRAYIPEYF